MARTTVLLEEFSSAACRENPHETGLGAHEPRRSPTGLLYCGRCGVVARPVETPSRNIVSDTQRAQYPTEPARRATVGVPSSLPDAEVHGSCRYCRSPLSESSRTREHLRPRSRGGAKAGRNIAASCSFCNSLKGPLTDGEFLTWLETGRIEASVPFESARCLARYEERGLRILILRARLAETG